MKKAYIALVSITIIVLASFLYWLNKDNAIDLGEKTKTEMSPTQIMSIRSIGQWEFLSISDEELVDTIRKGYFTDDQLVRIYYGTLRLGIDLSEAREDWIKKEGDSIHCTLPCIKLLDERFIDEAKTRSFFESGKWTNADRQALYEKAYQMMKKHCITTANLRQARDNGRKQFIQMIRTMGFDRVKVGYEDE